MKMNLTRVLLLAGVALIVSNASIWAHTDVTAEQAQDLIDSTEDIFVVDVRERSEYCDAVGHIPGALNYPWNSGVLQARYEALPMQTPILVVCRSGNRSNQAATFLDSKGFSTVYNMLGGMRAWRWETAPCKYAGGNGTANDPYQIATAADLIALGETPEDYDRHLILTADIDLDPNLPGRRTFDEAVIAPQKPDSQGRRGGDGTQTRTIFTGVIDGDNHLILNLVIEGEGGLGLFGAVGDKAKVSNIGLEGIRITNSGPSRAGALIGENEGDVSNCYSTGTVVSTEYVGGLVGTNEGSISDSHSSVVVNGKDFAGGLVGSNDGDLVNCYSCSTVSGVQLVGGLAGINAGTITHCYSTSTVAGISSPGFDTGRRGDFEGSESFGGLVGANGGDISNSHSIGIVMGNANVGGLAGSNSGSIITSHSDGAVRGNEQIGGLVGENQSGIISRCYSTATAMGTENVGGLVGTNLKGNIIICHSVGEVTGEDKNVGGLAGENWDGSITVCYSTSTVTASEYVGGLVGRNRGGVSNCYYTGQISGSDHAGGLVGMNQGSIASSFSTGIVTGTNNVGGLTGSSSDLFGGSVSNCFWDTQKSGLIGNPDGMGLTTSEMLNIDVYLNAGWDFANETSNGTCDYWKVSPGGYPQFHYDINNVPIMPDGLGTVEEPYLIRDVNDLGMVWFKPMAYYRMDTNVDLGGIIWPTAVIPWFEGIFDGNGHVINDLQIQGGGYLGLFGQLEGEARVLDVSLDAVDIDGVGSYVGGLAGANHARFFENRSQVAIIVNCRSSGLVKGDNIIGGLIGLNSGIVSSCSHTGKIAGNSAIGGLMGVNSSTISNCGSAGKVSGDGNDIGGLVGKNRGNIITCSSTVEVSGYWTIGGLVGENRGGNISNSNSDSSVLGKGDVGGLVGWNNEAVNNCFSSSMVAGTENVGGLVGNNSGHVVASYSDGVTEGIECIGGLVGRNGYQSAVDTCYSTGMVVGSEHVGGLVGRTIRGFGYDGIVISSFWDIETTGQETSDGGEGKTTAEMQMASTFLEAGWDFVGEAENGTEDIWWIDERQDYPRLWWESAEGEF